nr:MAG TPA: hypothetical protein [Caudoviricetes sp.]
MLFIHLQQHNCAQVVYIAQFILRKTPVLSGHSCKTSHSEPLFLREAQMCFSTLQTLLPSHFYEFISFKR